MPIILGLIIAAAVGGGIGVVAEKALPTDPLYGFKVGVNENIRSAFAVGATAQANWDIEAANRRLDEAERLAAEGSLDAKTSADIASNFEAHVSSIKNEITKLRADKDFTAAAKATSDLEAVLKLHAQSLAQLNARSAGSGSLTTMLRTVDGGLGTAAALKVEIASDAAVTAKESSDASASTNAGASVNAGTSLEVRGGQNSSGASTSADGSVQVNIY